LAQVGAASGQGRTTDSPNYADRDPRFAFEESVVLALRMSVETPACYTVA